MIRFAGLAASVLLMGAVLSLSPAGPGAPRAALASDARTDALGVQREYLEDYILFRAFPTVVARYRNLVTASLGDRRERNRSVGVIGAGEGTGYGVFAIYLNDLGSEVGQDAQVDLAWAKQFEGAAVGAAVKWTSSRTADGSFVRTPIAGHDPRNPLTLAANQFSLTGGVKLDLADTDLLEAALETAWLTWRDDVSGSEDDGRISYRASVRMMNEVSPRTTLVPLVQFSHIDLTGRKEPDDTEIDSFNLGMAAHHTVNGSDLLILGIAANYFRSRLPSLDTGKSTELSRWDLPALFIALEFDVYDWLTARVGATKTVDVATRDPAGEGVPDTDVTNSRFFFGLGMGLHFDHFDVDATVNPDAVFTGGYLFSGESSRPLSRVTATYYF